MSNKTNGAGLANPTATEQFAMQNGHGRSEGVVASRLPTSGGMAPRRRGADYYDTILWRVLPRESPLGQGFVLGLTSAGSRAGVTTVAANLAIRAADHRVSPVLLIDANLARPQVERSFRLHGAPGLTELLAGECGLDESIHASDVDDLSIMPLGASSLVDRARVDQQGIAALMTELRGEFATIVIDLPSSADMRHSLLLAQEADAALLVVRCDGTASGAAKNAIHRLRGDGVNLVGSVVTQQKKYTPRWFQRWL